MLKYLILAVMLLGCGGSGHEGFKCNCSNDTILINNTVYVNFTKIVNITRNVTVIDKTGLDQCKVDQQKIFRLFQACISQNNSQQISNLTYLLDKKTKEYNNLLGRMRNITIYVK